MSLDFVTIVRVACGKQLNIDVNQLPESSKRLEIYPDFSIPLYDALLGAEQSLVNDLRDFKDRVETKLSPILAELDKTFPSKVAKQVKVESLIDSFYTGVYSSFEQVTAPYKSVPGEDEILGVLSEYGLDEFNNIYLIREGEIDNRLITIAQTNEDSWLNAGVQGENTLDRINHIVHRSDLVKTLNKVDNSYVFPEGLLSAEEVMVYKELSKSGIFYRLILAIRTGNFLSNYFDYMTLTRIKEIGEVLDAEINPKTPVVSNKNTEKVVTPTVEKKEPIEKV